VKASGGESGIATELQPSQTSHRFPYFLPDSRHFLYFALGTPELQGIYLATLDASKSEEPKRLTVADSAGVYLHPDWLLFIRQGVLVAQRLDVASSTLTGDVVTVAESVAYDVSFSVGAFSASRDGRVAYRPGGAGKRQLTWFDRRGNRVGTLGPVDDSIVAPQLSPDGRRVAVHRTVEGNTDIWIFDQIRPTPFTFDPALDRFPIWSKPEATHIVFDSQRKGARLLYKGQVISAGSETPLGAPGRDQAAWDLSPDGKFSVRGERSQNWKGCVGASNEWK